MWRKPSNQFFYDVDAQDERQRKIVEDWLRGEDVFYRRVTPREVVPVVTARHLWMFVGSVLIGAGLFYLISVIRAL